MADKAISTMASMERRIILCEQCARPARVHILQGYQRGAPIRRHYCLECADHASVDMLRRGTARAPARMSVGALLMIAGAILVLIGLLIDRFGYQGVDGFGWKQSGSMILGSFLAVLGVVMHADLVAIGGAVLCSVAVLSEVQGPAGAPGWGWRQAAVLTLGLVLILAGYLRRKRRHSRQLHAE